MGFILHITEYKLLFSRKKIQIKVKKCIQMNMKKCQLDLNLTPDITESFSPPRLIFKNKKERKEEIDFNINVLNN